MIEVQSLEMRYGTFTALKNVSFEAREGEILGLLGPNGAGKTTVMRILTTFLHPYFGTARVGGFDILENPIEARKITGYLPETAPLYQDMRVDEYLEFVGASRGISGKLLNERLDWIKDICSLKSVWKHTIFETSKGYRQRVGLGQALIHDPKILILDEPTSGLDPLQIIGIRDLIRNLSSKKTIIFSTHILPEVEALADRIVIISGGKIIAQGTRDELAKVAQRREEILLAVKVSRSELERELGAISGFEEIRHDSKMDQGFERFRVISQPGKTILSSVDELIKKKNWALKELSSREMDLEEIFISLLSGKKKN